MDRQNVRGVAYAAGIDAPGAGWDSHRVWRERVREARSVPGAEAPIELPRGTAGWDPLETWRVRVRAARHAAK